jgi:cytochrome P450
MIKYTVINFLRRAYNYSRHIGYQIKFRLQKKDTREQMLFLFGGRNDGWPTIGRDFYAKDLLFKQTITECNNILLNAGGSEILSYFEGPVNSTYFEDETRFTCITAIQIATTIVYNKAGIYPNAVMGVSLGETGAAFAAGALSMKEALLLSLSYVSIHKLVKVEYVILYLKLNLESAKLLCLNSPVWAEVIYEDDADSSLITCHKDDLKEVEQYLNAQQLHFKKVSKKNLWPYHSTKMIATKNMVLESNKEIVPRPLKCDFYSPTLGKLIPKYSIISPEYWLELPCGPVLVHRTLKAAITDSYKTFFQVGPPALSGRQFAASAAANIKVFNSSESNKEEINHFSQTVNSIGAMKLFSSSVPKTEEEFFEEYKANFNVNIGAPQVSYEYLRKFGSIHYLTQHQAWIVLNYDDIEQTLKEPVLYSSKLLREYDPILLGADPEVHKVIRTLLQPLFSPAVITEMGLFTAIIAEQMLTELCKRDSFDFVKDYSDPLSLLVLCNFFGLSSDDANRMLEYTGKNYHDPLYWQRLEEFFKEQFYSCELTKEDCLWGKLRNLVAVDQFTFADAISLLRIVWTAGMATTSALISTSINIALKDTILAGYIASDDKLISKFIEECLRLQTPLSAIYRITTSPTVLAGRELPNDTVVLLHLKSGMTDPNHYAEGMEFSISRPAKRHLAFGTGIHQCIGMGIARAEARSALQIVLSKLGEIKNYNVQEPEYITISELQTMSSLKLFKR